MAIQGLTLKQSMAHNIQAIMPQEEDKRIFENNLTTYLENLYAKYDESEEFQKNLLKDFLKQTLPNNFINTIGRIDLAIYNGPSPDSTVGVLFECKSLTNKNEMMSKERINSKAFQEIVSYYLMERIEKSNIEVKKCIITNGLSWFIFEAKEFEKYFLKNKKLIDLFKKWRAGQLSSDKTEFLYKEVIAPAIENAIDKGIKVAHFNLVDALKKTDKIEVKKNNLTQLYRFFTAENLLNKEIFTDSNKLNKVFYDELLYLMGIEEIKVNNVKVIQRLPIEKRQNGSLVENVINRLVMNDIAEETQYDIAIQLSVVWINRILFLKLLESQLVSFNQNEDYRFLNKEMIPTFEDLYDLFFGVLAKKIDQRSIDIQNKFSHVPYLNSSLFEETELERSNNGISIDRLREKPIKLYSKTVLKDSNNRRKTGSLDFLTYLYEFLNSYDFSTTLRHHSKSKNELINASVLGLIFEKINGYKDGSYFTPGRITMYMSRKAVRRAVIDKVNEVKGWNSQTIQDLALQIRNIEIAKEINEIINSLKICDPAVGSGHFLVSVLNELIVIKSELGVLFDPEGKILNSIHCTVVNDELIIQDFNGDNFLYNVGNAQSERIQKSLFHEKRKLIENCLFGVDINRNSVNICRLRLWIELLKNSYYYDSPESNIRQLITLPNIDINIKVGNSLLHNIPLDTELEKNRKKELKFASYYNLVSQYKETNDKILKKELTNKINEIKQRVYMSFNTPEVKKVRSLTARLGKVGQLSLFSSPSELREQKKKIADVERQLREAERQLERARSNPLFKDALEWRMEFPEILDQEGNYIGFDLIIANPPYIYSSYGSFSASEKIYFEKEYPLNKYQANTFGLFLELSLKLLKKGGYVSVIIPNSFLTIQQYNVMRKYILENTGDVFILNSLDKIFDDASIDNCIVNIKVTQPNKVLLAELENQEVKLINSVSPKELLNFDIINISTFKQKENNTLITSILSKMENGSKCLEPNYAIVRDGLKVYQKGKGDPKQPIDEAKFKKLKEKREWFSPTKIRDDYWEIVKGEHVERYRISQGSEFIKYGKFLAEPRSPEMFIGKRLLIRQIPLKSVYSLTAMYTDAPLMHERSLICIRELLVDPLFLLGVINSKVLSYYALHKFDMLQRKTFPQLRLYQIKALPIPSVEVEKQLELSKLVQEKINLHKIINPSINDKSEMEKLDNKIDDYVMELFMLSEEEKNIIKDFSI